MPSAPKKLLTYVVEVVGRYSTAHRGSSHLEHGIQEGAQSGLHISTGDEAQVAVGDGLLCHAIISKKRTAEAVRSG